MKSQTVLIYQDIPEEHLRETVKLARAYRRCLENWSNNH